MTPTLTDSRAALGFALVREVTRRHDGRIWAQAAPGGGTCFSLLFPSLVHRAAVNE